MVTGGGTGIGRAIAMAFADEGFDVTISGRRKEPLQSVAHGRNICTQVADVTSEADTERLFETSFDVVIANAGGGGAGKLTSVSLEAWNQTLAVNLTGTFLTFRAAMRDLQPGARLIAIASTASLTGNAAVPAYTAAKHGVLGLVRSVALDVAKKGATCNAICPGFVDTDLADTAISGLMSRFEMSREQATQKIASSNPQSRLIDPQEVAAAALYLASPAAVGVNGHALSISGGEV